MKQISDELVRRAEEYYEQELKAQLESGHLNQFVAIEPDSGDFFLGQTLSEAAQAFRKAHPNGQGFIMRIGHRAAVHIGAGI